MAKVANFIKKKDLMGDKLEEAQNTFHSQTSVMYDLHHISILNKSLLNIKIS